MAGLRDAGADGLAVAVLVLLVVVVAAVELVVAVEVVDDAGGVAVRVVVAVDAEWAPIIFSSL